ncbi:MAG TPA: hypothetical protein VF618_10185 [Thermoanaerobaculia bacterium]
MLATEPTNEQPAEPSPNSPWIEVWGQNERMRHIPTTTWMIAKLDGDLRQRIDKLWSPFAGDAPHGELEQEFRALCRSLARLADVARHSRNNHPPNDLGHRIHWELNHAVSSLQSLDADLIGRRYPMQTHERSKGEPLYAALLTVIGHVQKLLPLVREVDPGIDERLYEGLVHLENPVDDRMLRPIA